MCTTSFNIKFLHFSRTMYVSVPYACYDKEPAISLGSNPRWVLLLQKELAVSDERTDCFVYSYNEN